MAGAAGGRPCERRRRGAGSGLAAAAADQQRASHHAAINTAVVRYCAWTELTVKAPPVPWHTAQLSPSVVVLERKCDAVGISTWQPEHAEAIGCTGLIGPCGSVTGFKPGQ